MALPALLGLAAGCAPFARGSFFPSPQTGKGGKES